MGLNKDILMKLDHYTKDNQNIRDFLLDIIKFESQDKGWFDKEYNKILLKHFKEEINEI